MIISGAFHYFRVHPRQWRERLELLKLMGLDTVETYVPWNLHEPRPGQFRFTGIADLEGFLKVSTDVGLSAIVRPGPYICAEWDNGGLPSWLTARPGIAARTSDPDYLKAVDAWFDELVPRIAAHQVSRGGNVTMVQVENEYGSFGSDTSYLRHLRDGLLRRGIDVALFTSDGPEDHMLTGGTVPEVAATVNFGSRPDEAFAALRRHRRSDEPFCMEFWNGWFDHWGEPHHRRDTADAAKVLDEMLAAGASVNIYMAHGGTNFGCGAGANHDDGYQPTVTSYDYDAPLDERGAPTAKFWAFREVIAKHRTLPPIPHIATPRAMDEAVVTMTDSVPLADVFDDLATVTAESAHAPTFEEVGVDHGLVRYRTRIPGPRQAYALTLPRLADRAHVYVDGSLRAVFDRDAGNTLSLPVPLEGCELELLVESMGRVNYGPRVGEHKGLVGGVLHERQQVHGWQVSAVELPYLGRIDWSRGADDCSSPGLHRGRLDVRNPHDTFLSLDGWTKGYVWVNGFCLGRYWNRGPQRTLFVPAPLLHAGANEFVVLELDGRTTRTVRIEAEPDLGD